MKPAKLLKLLRTELTEFEKEFDTSDPEWTQILFKTRVSNLIKKGVFRTKKLPRKVRLAEIIEALFPSQAHGEIMEAAETVDDVLHSYGDEPDKEEMDRARESLDAVIDFLGGLENNEVRNAN